MAKVPEQIVPGVYRVDAVGLPYGVSVLLIRDSDGWALVDTGRNSLRIQQALAALGAGPSDLKRIYLTHHHSEHAGGLSDLLWWAPHAELWTSRHEARIISGRSRPDWLSNPLFRPFAAQGLPTVPIGRIQTVVEGKRFAGFRVIATPGHTYGHTSLLSEQHRLLFAADALGGLLEIRAGVIKGICANPMNAKRSAEKLLKEEFDAVVFSHGKPLREDAKQRLREALAADV